MKHSLLTLLLAAFSSAAVFAAEPPQCKQQTVEKSVIEMCLLPGAAFQHDFYTLKADKVLIFALVDDYSEKVELEHAIPEGVSIEPPYLGKVRKSSKSEKDAFLKVKTALKLRKFAISTGESTKSSRTFDLNSNDKFKMLLSVRFVASNLLQSYSALGRRTTSG